MANPDGLDLWYKQGTFNYLRLYGEDRQNPITGWLYVDEGSVVTKAMTEHLAHADLSDMPDVGGTNTDHDARYYTETETGTLLANYIEKDGTTTTTASIPFAEGLTSSGHLTVGVDGTGHDVKFFGATSGKYMLWDESADCLVIEGDLNVDDLTVTDDVSIGDKLDVGGTLTASGLIDQSAYDPASDWDPIYLVNTLLAEGFRSGFLKHSSNDKVFFNLVTTTAGSSLFSAGVSGDTYRRLRITADGTIYLGSGSAIADVKFYRSSANVLRTDDTFRANNYQSGDGTLGITQSETGVTDFDIVIKDGLITSFTKN